MARRPPQMLETMDFRGSLPRTLNGHAAGNKGFSLFPRLIHGASTCCTPGQRANLYLISDMPTGRLLYRTEPIASWKFVQLGNCGSPIEPDRDGWC